MQFAASGRCSGWPAYFSFGGLFAGDSESVPGEVPFCPLRLEELWSILKLGGARVHVGTGVAFNAVVKNIASRGG
jgi:hypothetical protein